jgi:hypothetical protein
MTMWLKIPVGLAALASGGALFISSGAALANGLLVARTGLALPNVFFFAVSLCGLGAAADCLGPPRKSAKPTKDNLAKSIWAERAHVNQWDIGEN